MGRGILKDMPPKLTNEIFIERSMSIHSNRYDYSLVNYFGAKSKVRVICSIHGVFEIWPFDHMNGVGCVDCYHSSKKLTNYSFIEKAIDVHGSRYNYELVEYREFNSRVKIICQTHGVFQQKPYVHLRGCGCRKCFVDTMIVEVDSFLEKAKRIHNGKYTYDIGEYINLRSDINIICPIHSIFKQKANNHYNGAGCPLCSHSNISKMETLWLDTLHIPDSSRNKVIFINDKRYNLDAIDNKIIYEFYGDFWHGNPKIYNPLDINPTTKRSYGELYQATMEREKILISAGYKIVSIWENDFEKENQK